MPNIVIQIEHDKQTLYAVTLEDASITKQTIEATVLQATGLTYDQYEVFYMDSENDLIMTVVEEDYSIAEMTLEADTIAFHIDVKVPLDQVKLAKKNQEIPHAEEKIQQGSDLSEDVSQEQKFDQVYKSANSQQNYGEQEDILQEKTQVQTQNLSNQNVQRKEQQQNESKQKTQNMVGELVGEKLNKQQPKNQMEKSKSEDIQCGFEGLNQNSEQEKEDYQRLAPQNQESKQQIKQDELINNLKYLEYCHALFEKLLQKLTIILKPECFKTHPNTTVPTTLAIKEHTCLLCSEMITKTPYYINQRNQMICQQCEKKYEGAQNLVKIRNQASKTDILATKLLTLSYNQLSKQDLLYFAKEIDPKNRSKKIEQLLLQKMRCQKTE